MLGSSSGSLRKLNVALLGLAFAVAGCASEDEPAEDLGAETAVVEPAPEPAPAEELEDTPAETVGEGDESSPDAASTESPETAAADREEPATRAETAGAQTPAPAPTQTPTPTATPTRAAAPAASRPTPAPTAQPAAQAGLSAAALVDARAAFSDWSCGACHALADAGAAGQIGPSLDKNPNLTQRLVVDRITHGQGAMPGFGGQMSEAEIEALAQYIMQTRR